MDLRRTLCPLVLCLLTLCAGCDRVPLPDWSFLHPVSAAGPLQDVLPGQWKVLYKGHTYLLTFGQHSDMSFVVDVPQEYRARLGTDQLWIGGNYHVESNHELNCEFTEGRWAVLVAQMKGLEMHHCGIKSYTRDQIIDGEDVTWTRVGQAPSARHGEAIDIADQPPAVNDAPRAKTPAAGAKTKPSLAEQQSKLTAMFQHLENKRKTLNVQDKVAVAAFNREAAEYSRQVAQLNTGATNVAATSAQ